MSFQTNEKDIITHQPTIPSIPDDCIIEILSYLEKDKNSLFNCVKVNRTWSRLTVPLLWKDPLKNCSSYYKIIRTLILCINQETKEELEEKINHISELLSTSYTPLFNYPSFIRSFDNLNLIMSIKIFLQKVTNDEPKFYDWAYLIELLGDLIFERTIGFESLKVRFDDIKDDQYAYEDYEERGGEEEEEEEDYDDDDDDEYNDGGHYDWTLIYDITRFANFEIAVSNIKTFETTYFYFHSPREQLINSMNNKLMKEIGKCCRNIETLSCNNPEIFDGPLVSLTKSQKSIKTFSYYQGHDNNDPIYSLISVKMGNSLKSLKLNCLKDFEGLLSVLSACTKCEYLEITNEFHCEGSVELLKNIRNMSFIRIKHLHLYKFNIYIIRSTLAFYTSVELLFRLSNNNLRSLTVEGVNYSIIESIGKYCNLLSYLSIKLSPFLFPRLISNTFPLLNNLEHLVMMEENFYESQGNNDFKFPIKLLAKSFPSSLRHLGFEFISFNSVILKSLLDEIEVPIRTLDIYESCENIYVKIISDYIETKNPYLKKVGFGRINKKEISKIKHSIKECYLVKSYLHDSTFKSFVVRPNWLF